MDKDVIEEREQKKNCVQCGKELKNFKEIKFGGQVFKVCDKKCEKLFIADMTKERKDRLKKTEEAIAIDQKELAYKKIQFKGEVVEKNQSVLYNLRSFPKDDLKPKFVLEIEINMIEESIKKREEIIKNIKEAEEKDGNS